jgi:hypothetical protein
MASFGDLRCNSHVSLDMNDQDELLCFHTVRYLRLLIGETEPTRCLPVNLLLCVLASKRFMGGWLCQLVDSDLEEPRLSAIEAQALTQPSEERGWSVFSLYIFDPFGEKESISRGAIIYAAAVADLVMLNDQCYGAAAMNNVLFF